MSADPVSRELVIFGAWYLADVIEELAVSAGWSVVGRVDPAPPPGGHQNRPRRVVGTGATVIRDVLDGQTVVGNPARPYDATCLRTAGGQSDWRANTVW